MMGRSIATIAAPLVWAALMLVAFGVTRVSAQDPTPPPPPADTADVQRDTADFVVPPEQLPADTFLTAAQPAPADSLVPAPNFPVFPSPAPAGWAAARWVWNREELLRFHGLSVLDLLRQVPSLTVTRAGVFGRPTGVAAFGLGGGRLRVFVDGYELDAFVSAGLDLQYVALVDLEELRLDRGLTETRVELTTFRLDDSRPFSQVEAATGNDQTRLLRALFARQVGQRNVMAVGFDLVDTEGVPANQPYTATTAFARWSYRLAPEAGVQVEYRQTGVVASDPAFVEQSSYRDLILRGRARPLPGLAVDAQLGRSWRIPDNSDSLGIQAAATKLVLRGVYERGVAWLDGGAHFRFGEQTGYPRPDLDLALRGGVRPLPLVAVSGEARYTGLADISGTELSGTVRLGPWLGFSLFGTTATGARGVGVARDTTFEVLNIGERQENGATVPDSILADTTVRLFSARRSSVDAFRAGAEWSARGATLGAAIVTVDADVTVPFGLPFDALVEPINAPGSSMVEAYVSAPLLLRGPLRVDAAYSYSLDPVSRPYLPTDQWRVALTYHNLFYTGNLEPTFRVEALRRGSAVVPLRGEQVFGARSEPYTLVNFYAQIRVIDVRAFVIVENLLNVVPADLPGRPFGGQRTLYGVRWHFHN
jgi:hypothetical protein